MVYIGSDFFLFILGLHGEGARLHPNRPGDHRDDRSLDVSPRQHQRLLRVPVRGTTPFPQKSN